MGEKELRRLVTENIVERVEPNSDTALQEIGTARRHLESARRIADDDPPGAFAMAYDAMRKAVAAHMRARGYRVNQSEYEALLIEPDEVEEILRHAGVLVDAVEGDLGL